MVDICIVDTYTNITAGRKEAIPQFEEVAAKNNNNNKNKREQRRKREERKKIYRTKVIEKFTRNSHKLLATLGFWLSGFAKCTTHTLG